MVILSLEDQTLFVRDREIRPLKKETFGCFEVHLSFWVSGMELPLIFSYKKKKKKKKIKKNLQDQNASLLLIE